MAETKKEPIGFISLLKESWKTYKENFVALTLVYFIPAIFFSFSENIVLLFRSLSPLRILSILFFIPLYCFIVFLGYIALIIVLRDRNGDRARFSETYKKALPYFFSYFWLVIISLLMLLPLFLLIVPGIIFGTFFLLAPFILITEKINGFNALWRSKELIKNYWWNVLWYNIVISLATVIIHVFLLLVVLLPLTVLTISLNLPFSRGAFSQIQSFVLTLFLTPFFCTFFYLLYEKIKNIKKETVFSAPSKKTKIIFTVLGVLGLLIIIFFFQSIFSLLF